jgi:hypothetical protein
MARHVAAQSAAIEPATDTGRRMTPRRRNTHTARFDVSPAMLAMPSGGQSGSPAVEPPPGSAVYQAAEEQARNLQAKERGATDHLIIAWMSKDLPASRLEIEPANDTSATGLANDSSPQETSTVRLDVMPDMLATPSGDSPPEDNTQDVEPPSEAAKIGAVVDNAARASGSHGDGSEILSDASAEQLEDGQQFAQLNRGQDGTDVEIAQAGNKPKPTTEEERRRDSISPYPASRQASESVDWPLTLPPAFNPG